MWVGQNRTEKVREEEEEDQQRKHRSALRALKNEASNYIVIMIQLAVADIGYINNIEFGISPHTENLLYFAVHSFAMLSTITNPILYGWLNTNLKHLFRAMIPTVRNERTHQPEPEYETYTPFQNIRLEYSLRLHD